MRHAAVVVMVLGACGHADVGARQAVPAEWAGDEPHVVLGGEIDGEAVDLHLGPAQLAESPSAWCLREYAVPDVGDPSGFRHGRLTAVEITWSFEPGHEVVPLRMERPDFTLDGSGVPLPVRARLGHSVGRGTFVLGRLDGAAGPDGLVVPAGEGKLGGALRIDLPGHARLEGTFTIPCTHNRLVELPAK